MPPEPQTPSTAQPAAPTPSTAANAGAAPATTPSRIAPGSVIPVELTKTVDAKKVKPGDEVVAKVTGDLKNNAGTVIVPKDTKIVGHVPKHRPAQTAKRVPGDRLRPCRSEGARSHEDAHVDPGHRRSAQCQSQQRFYCSANNRLSRTRRRVHRPSRIRPSIGVSNRARRELPTNHGQLTHNADGRAGAAADHWQHARCSRNPSNLKLSTAADATQGSSSNFRKK